MNKNVINKPRNQVIKSDQNYSGQRFIFKMRWERKKLLTFQIK